MVQLRIQLTGGQQHDHGQIHPRQQHDDAADRSVRLVVRREIGDVDAEQECHQEPQHRPDHRAHQNLFRVLLDVRQVAVDEVEGDHDERDRDRILQDRPREHEVPIEVQLGTDCLREFRSREHHDARNAHEQSHHEHGCELDESAFPPRACFRHVVRGVERVHERTEHRTA